MDLSEIESKIVKILEEKIRPAVARDGGDIKFKEFKDGVEKANMIASKKIERIKEIVGF